jgi:hypothetical protein
VQGAGAAVDGDGMLCVAVGSKLLLERADVWPQDVFCAGQNIEHRLIDFILDAHILGVQIHEIHHESDPLPLLEFYDRPTTLH